MKPPSLPAGQSMKAGTQEKLTFRLPGKPIAMRSLPYEKATISWGEEQYSLTMNFWLHGPLHYPFRLRGEGLGKQLWTYRLKRLQTRLAPGASIGMDGVFAMVPFYERGGFGFAHKDVRFQGIAQGALDAEVQELDPTTLAIVDRFDRLHFPAPRTSFLQRWMFQRGAHTLGLFERGELAGYGVARPARMGYKIGPLFASRPDVAERLARSLMARVAGEQVQLDVPEPNDTGIRLASALGLTEVFGCARMYYGVPPNLPMSSFWGHFI